MAEVELGEREITGCRISMMRAGAGDPVLFLHGANGAAAWLPFMDELSENYELFVPEHPGFGRSQTPDWLDNIHDLAYFYLDLIDGLDRPKVHVIGVSLGGWVALEMAVRNTARIASLTLVGSAGIHVRGVGKGDIFMWSPEEAAHQLVADRSLAPALIPETPEEQELALKNRFATAKLAWQPRLYDPNLHKWLHRINVPAQIVWGDTDRVIPPAYAASLQRFIPGSRVAVLKNCGHLPHIEKPHELVRIFGDFVSESCK